VGTMPDWFAKTPEMVASDTYFSLADAVSEAALIARYQQALTRFGNNHDDYGNASDMLNKEWAGRASDIDKSLHQHFLGDWIHYLYYRDPATYGSYGGAYWPSVCSQKVVDRIREGTKVAIYKALGASNLPAQGLAPGDITSLFGAQDVTTEGVVGLATSWVCVAPAGTDYFEVAAVRSQTVVELSIATPKPYGHSSIMGIVQGLIDGTFPKGG
jgi:hypothetical protein